MFSNRDVKRVRAELLRDAECPEDDPHAVRARLEDAPPVLVRQLATTGTPPPSPPRSPEGRSLLPRLDKPAYREDLSIFNWRTREEHEEIVRRFRASTNDVSQGPVPVTRQNAIHPTEAQSSVAVDVPLTVRRTTSRWSDDPVRTSDMDVE